MLRFRSKRIPTRAHSAVRFPRLPRLAPACLARYETSFAPATRAAAQTKRPDLSLPPRCRYVWRLVASPRDGRVSGLPVERSPIHLCSVKHASHGFQGPHLDTALLRAHSPRVWIGAVRGGGRYLGAAGRAGQGQLGTTHCQRGRVRGRGCLGRRRCRTARGADRTGGGVQFTCRGRVNPKCQTELVRNRYCITSYLFFIFWFGKGYRTKRVCVGRSVVPSPDPAARSQSVVRAVGGQRLPNSVGRRQLTQCLSVKFCRK